MTTNPTSPVPKRRRKAEPAPTTGPTPARVVRVKATAPKGPRAATLAKLTADGMLPLTFAAQRFALGIAGEELDLTAMHERMAVTARDAASGDLGALERMLSGQAQTLNIMFTELARRAAMNMGGEHLEATETYLRLALKAQGQCRATVEALAEIKTPRAVAFVKAAQANISNGPQQVNNDAAVSHTRTEDSPKPANELLEDATHEQQQRMVPGAQAAPARGNPEVEAVGAVHRAEDARGEGRIVG